MKRTIRLLAAPAAALLILAACGNVSDDSAEPATTVNGEAGTELEGDTEDGAEVENVVYEQGTFTAQNDTGAEFTIEIPAEAPSDIEAYREAIGQDPVGYVKIEIDNSAGTENAGPSTVYIVDEEGNQLAYESAFTVIGDWGPTMRDDGPEDENDGYWYSTAEGEEISEDEYDHLNSQGNELYNAHLEDSALPRAQAVAYYIGPEVPESFVYVEVQEAMMPYPAEPAA